MEMTSETSRMGIVLMIFSALTSCTGQLLWKLSVTNGFAYIIIGFFVYAMGALLMIVAYRFGKLSVLQPIMSLAYVFSIFLGFFFLNESISIMKCISVILIIIGVFFIALGDEK